jgi:ribonuclease HII
LLPLYALIGVGEASVEEIDALNILQATLLAMRRAVERLPVRPAVALVDGNKPPDLRCQVRTVVAGDSLSLSIAAASIVAKVTRDRVMTELARAHPGYGWEHNAGYGTAEHHQGIVRLGVTAHHRRSFRPISEVLNLTH